MTHWTQVNGTAIRYDLARAPAKVVLIHELAGSLNSWDGVMPYLPPETLRYDLRGSGMSEKVRGTLALDTLVADVAALIGQTGAGAPVTIAGAAVGGLVAAAFAAAHPEKVARLVLVGPALAVPQERRAAASATADRIEAEGLRAVADAVLPLALPEELWADPARRDPAVARWLGADPAGYAALYRMLIAAETAQMLTAIACPVDVLAGRFDPFGTPELVDRLTAAIPDRRFSVLEGGHFLHVQSPQVLGPVLAGLI